MAAALWCGPRTGRPVAGRRRRVAIGAILLAVVVGLVVGVLGCAASASGQLEVDVAAPLHAGRAGHADGIATVGHPTGRAHDGVPAGHADPTLHPGMACVVSIGLRQAAIEASVVAVPTFEVDRPVPAECRFAPDPPVPRGS